MTPVSATGIASLKRRVLNLFCAFGAAALLLVPSLVSAQVVLSPALQNFGALAASTVTNTGPSAVTGDVGVAPLNAIVGFPPGTLTGTLRPGTAPAVVAQGDLTAAFVAATATVCNVDLSGIDLGGLILTPNTYCFATSAGLTGNLTLNFLGNPNAAFLFKTGSTLTTAAGSSVLAVNTGGAGCLPNVNFQIGSSATLGTNSNFAGNILAQASVTLTTGANLRGRALARTAAVTLDSNLAVGGCPNAAAFPGGPLGGAGVIPAPTLQEWALIFLGLMLAGVGGWHVRRKIIFR